jgi:hypothetical protein
MFICLIKMAQIIGHDAVLDNLGNFSNSKYWSSTNSSGGNAISVNFNCHQCIIGTTNSEPKSTSRPIRAIRAFEPY